MVLLFIDRSLTTQIGTALYASPELTATGSERHSYTQKVDMYSAGVVLFEMFYRPLPLGMERIQILTGLRQQPPSLPEDLAQELSAKTRERLLKILVWTLSERPEARASAEELLDSDLLPAPEMQELEFQSSFTKALANPQTRSYKWLMGRLFDPERFPNSAQDYCFDRELDVYKVYTSPDSLIFVQLRQNIRSCRNIGAEARQFCPSFYHPNKTARFAGKLCKTAENELFSHT